MRERKGISGPGTDQRGDALGAQAMLARANSAPQLLQRRSVSMSEHMVWPPAAANFERTAPPATVETGTTDRTTSRSTEASSHDDSQSEQTITVQSPEPVALAEPEHDEIAEDASPHTVAPDVTPAPIDSGRDQENPPPSPRSSRFETSPRSSDVDRSQFDRSRSSTPDLDAVSNERERSSRSPSPPLTDDTLTAAQTHEPDGRSTSPRQDNGHFSDSSGRGNVSSHLDASAELSPLHSSHPINHEIIEEHDSDSTLGANQEGDGSPVSDPSAISRDDRPLRRPAPDRGNPADMLFFHHDVKNPHRFASNIDTTIVGIHSKSRPPRAMALGRTGPKLNPIPEPEAAETGTVDAPPSARPEGGLRKDRKLRAIKAVSRMLVPKGLFGSKADPATQGKTRVDQIVPALTDATALEGRIESLFASGNEAGEHTALASTLRVALGAGGPEAVPDGNRTELAFTHHLMIADRLAQATGGDAARALQAFDALQQGRFLPFSTVDAGDGTPPTRLDELLTLPSGRPSRAQAQLDALSVAAKLASSPSGFEALLRTLQPALPENRQPHLRRLLEAVGKVEAERGASGDIANHLITARSAMETGQATLAQHVLHIESRALEQAGNDPHASLNAKDKAAIFSWENGFRDRGPGTQLAKVQGRLAKMGKYVQRANHLQELRNVKFDSSTPVRSTAKVIDAKARILAMRAQQTIGRKKSPLTGLRRFGANNNLLKHPDDDPAVLDGNTIAAVNMLHEKYAAAVADPRDFDVALQDPRSKALPDKVLVEALLAHWQSHFGEGGMRPLGLKLDSAAQKKIAQYIAARYGVDTEQTRGLIAGHLRTWATSNRKGWTLRRKGDRELTLGDLQKWADDIGMRTREFTALGKTVASGVSPGEATARAAVAPEPEGNETPPDADAVAGAPTYIQETEFGASLRKALNVIDTSAVRPDDLTPDGLHRFTRMYLLEHPWGNPLVAANGGTAGINTSSISDSIHKITKKFSPVSVTPILDLRLARTNNAVLSIGSTTHGGEIFIGTQRQTAGSIGGGLSAAVGPDALKKFLGQMTGSAELTPLAVESVKTRGVMVRALRPQKPDRSGHDSGAARDELVRFNDLMWSMAKGEHGKLDPEQAWELISDRFFDSSTLSIGWQDQEAKTVHHPFTASLGLRLGHSVGKKIAGAFSSTETERAGVSVGIATDLTTLGSNRRNEETGRNRMVRANYLWRFQANMTLGGTQTNPPIPASHAAGPITASIASGPSSITRTFALDDRGFNATFRTIVKSGKLSDAYTLREFEERDAKQFVAAMNRPERRAQFVQVFKATYGNEAGEQELDKFLAKAKNWAGAGQHYVTRYRMRDEDRKTLDELAAYAHTVGQRDPKDPMLANIERAMKARLEDEDTWIPIQTFSLEGQAAREAIGVNLGIQFSAQDTIASDRELSAVVAPLPIADQWTQIRRDQNRPAGSDHVNTDESSAEDRRAGS